jgi:hypothetical protein
MNPEPPWFALNPGAYQTIPTRCATTLRVASQLASFLTYPCAISFSAVARSQGAVTGEYGALVGERLGVCGALVTVVAVAVAVF